MLKMFLRLITRDPLKKMLIDTPLEIIRQGADQGAQHVAEFVRDTALINAPWHSGMMANSHSVYRPRRINKLQAERGVLATRRIAVDARRDDGHYYPIAIEFGWEHSPDGFPWLRDALHESEGEAHRIYRREMAAAIKSNGGKK